MIPIKRGRIQHEFGRFFIDLQRKMAPCFSPGGLRYLLLQLRRYFDPRWMVLNHQGTYGNVIYNLKRQQCIRLMDFFFLSPPLPLSLFFNKDDWPRTRHRLNFFLLPRISVASERKREKKKYILGNFFSLLLRTKLIFLPSIFEPSLIGMHSRSCDDICSIVHRAHRRIYFRGPSEKR